MIQLKYREKVNEGDLLILKISLSLLHFGRMNFQGDIVSTEEGVGSVFALAFFTSRGINSKKK